MVLPNENNAIQVSDIEKVRRYLRLNTGDGVPLNAIRNTVDRYTESTYGLKLNDYDFSTVLDKAIQRALDIYGTNQLLRDEPMYTGSAVAFVTKKPIDELMAERGISAKSPTNVRRL